jgi:hypothetical protein
MHRSVYPVFAAALFLTPLPALAQTPGAVQAAQSPAMPGPAMSGPGKVRKPRVNPLAGFLTPEQQSMYMVENRAKLQSVPAEQRKAFRKQQIGSLMAMSQSDRQKLQMELQAKWDALPPKQKTKMENRLAARAARQTAAQ